MATVEQTQQLAEARAARHKLMTGTAVVRVNKDGMSVEYTRATLTQLNEYIDALARVVEGTGRRMPPAGVRF
ncbi:hypothetical protein CA267_001780 [Alteromonas pelagimontana]|uniref:Phage tail protein n=1 Tax=Alteromonas pelagimontana TaxID=1858656 RepID=A0A6M4M8X6_9ALTE|nr:gpW family head-tail joining protein [Alteromonas pelagimontana]QJR79613.1 hypothetical protein CA267_001780 [Alteromonas pelagimontana]